MGAMASQITSLTIVYSTAHSGADQRKAPRHWPLCGEFTGDRGIPRTNGHEREKMFPFDDVITIGVCPCACLLWCNRYIHTSTHAGYVQVCIALLWVPRLRIDMNCLATCKTKKKSTQGRAVCPMCNQGSETVDHFLLNCKHFHDIRLRFLTSVKPYTKCFVYFNSVQKLRYILDLNCPPDVIKICCSFVSELYRKRECT